MTRCARPAPGSPAGYGAALAALPSGQWGAADLSISVPLPDGRSVWLYGDTLTGSDTTHLTGLVHSSAVVQDRGCLHVSRGGAQLVPTDSASRISWVASAIALDDQHLLVATTQQLLTGTCAFCFRQVGQRGAILDVTGTGDVVFDHWLPRWPAWNGEVTWGVGIARHGSTVVLYGISPTGLARDLYAATATITGAARGAFHLDARPVAHGMDPAGVTAWYDARGWHVLTLRGTYLVRLDSVRPVGPFTERPVGTIPVPAPGQLRYMAAAHPEETLTGGLMLVTVCSNWVDGKARPLASFRPAYLALPR